MGCTFIFHYFYVAHKVTSIMFLEASSAQGLASTGTHCFIASQPPPTPPCCFCNIDSFSTAYLREKKYHVLNIDINRKDSNSIKYCKQEVGLSTVLVKTTVLLQILLQ